MEHRVCTNSGTCPDVEASGPRSKESSNTGKIEVVPRQDVGSRSDVAEPPQVRKRQERKSDGKSSFERIVNEEQETFLQARDSGLRPQGGGMKME